MGLLNMLARNPALLGLSIPILAILTGLVAVIAKHRERMAMIERGMNPDQVKLDRERALLAKDDVVPRR